MSVDWPDLETEIGMENPTEEVSYVVKSVMLSKASLERGDDAAAALWGPSQLLDNRVGVALNAQPSYRKMAGIEHHYLASLPVTAEYRRREPGDVKSIVPRELKMDAKTLLLIKVEYAGVFEIVADGERLKEFLRTAAPTMLFPYVSMTISDLLAKTGCQPLLLPPIDFAALKRQAIAEAVSDASATRQ